MHCPFCGHEETKVIDSRLAGEGRQIRRRRQCLACNERFTTFETAELVMPRLIKNDNSRQPFDENKLRNSMVRALEGEGTTAHASWTLFPENDQLDKAKVLIAVNEQEFDAVVIARLRSVYEEEEYVPGKPLTSSDLYMSGYNEAYAVNRDPGYYKTNTTYRVETALYSARDEMVAWVVLSDTVNPNSVEEVIQSVSSSIAKRMKAEGLID